MIWSSENEYTFISLMDFNSISERGIYTDLLRQFKALGHKIYVISPVERRNGKRDNHYR